MLLDADKEQSISNVIEKNDVAGLSNNLQTINRTYDYQYNANNYPILNIQRENVNGVISIQTTQFFY